MKLDPFVRQYLETALWSSLQDNDVPFDNDYDVNDFAPSAIIEATDDCNAFREANAADLAATGADDERNGHDFWLTRNGHGTGFWDRGYGDVGKRLSDAAKACGTADVVVADNGLLLIE